MINKNEFSIQNTKKVLHKVGKQWVVVSAVLLGLVAGSTVINRVNADVVQPIGQNTQNVNIQQKDASNNPSQDDKSLSNSISIQKITNNAKTLHSSVMRNSNQVKSNNNLLDKNSNISNTPVIKATGKWNNANVNYYSNNVMELTGNGIINASDVPALPTHSGSSYMFHNWTLKIDKNNAHIIMNNSKNGGEFSANYYSIWNNFKSMDLSGLDTSRITNMNNMFENDNLSSLNVDNFDTSNVTKMDYMFSGNEALTSLDLSSFDTRKSSMNNFFGTTYNYSFDDISKITLGANTYIPGDVYKLINPDNRSDIFATNNKNSTLIHVSTGDNGKLLKSDGTNVTSDIKTKPLSSGTYYFARPVEIYIYGQDNIFETNKFIYLPVIMGKGASDEEYVSGWSVPQGYHEDIQPLVTTQLKNLNIFNNDYKVNSSESYHPSIVNSDQPVVKVSIDVNNSKFIHDAASNVSKDLKRANSYANDIQNDKPYTSDSEDIYGNNYENYVQHINDDNQSLQHDLEEPMNSYIAKSASTAEENANVVINRLKSYANEDNSKAANIQISNSEGINSNLSVASNILTRATDTIRDNNINYIRSNASFMSSINSYESTISKAKNEIAKDISMPTLSASSNAESQCSSAASAFMNTSRLLESAYTSSASSANRAERISASEFQSTVSKYISNAKINVQKAQGYTSSIANNEQVKSDPYIRRSLILDEDIISDANSRLNDIRYATSYSYDNAKHINSYVDQTKSSGSSILQQASEYAKSIAESKVSSNANQQSATSMNSDSNQSSNSTPSNTSQSTNSQKSASNQSQNTQSNQNTDNNPQDRTSNQFSFGPVIPPIPNINTSTAPSTQNTSSMSASSTIPRGSNNVTSNHQMNSNSSSSNVASKSSVNGKSSHSSKRIINHNYLRNNDFKHTKKNKSVVSTKGLYEYKRDRKGKLKRIIFIKPGIKLAIKRVVRNGRITKLELTNGNIVTANKHFVKLANVRRTKRVLTYARALSRATYRTRHGRLLAKFRASRFKKQLIAVNKRKVKAQRRFNHHHTRRNHRILKKAINKLNQIENILLK